VSDPKNQLAFRLKMMVEKLVGSSPDRRRFEEDLEKTFEQAITGRLRTQEDSSKLVDSLSISNTQIDDHLFNLLADIQAHPQNFQKNKFRDIFRFGQLADQSELNEAYNNEMALVLSIGIINFRLNDRRGDKQNDWNKSLLRFFNSLLKNDEILKMVYQMTEGKILEYLYDDPDGIDEMTKSFAEYIVHEIGTEAYESNIRFAIKAMINTEKRPKVPLVEVIRHLANMYPAQFNFSQISSWNKFFSSQNKLIVDVYGPEFNQAYLRAVSDTLATNIYRNVAVNLLDRMVEKLLEMTIDMFNQEAVRSQKNKVDDKILKLQELRKIIERYV